MSSRSIKSEIEAALIRHTRANSHNVQVDVKDTYVTLSGTVDNWSDRELARRTAWGTPGVHKVVNNISISW
jgi:osmotically-inducible protein OsmY